MLAEKSKQESDNGALTRFATASFGTYGLRYRCLPGQPEAPCSMLAIHGARSDLTRLDSLLLPLRNHGVGSLAFDLSGHTDQSPLRIHQTSLRQNLAEARRFADQLGVDMATVFGHSLGGALAMKVAEHHSSLVRTLILSCPAMYPEAAYAVPCYGPEFRETISKPFAFLDSASLDFLRRFGGTVILLTGEYDGLRAELHGGVAGRSAGTVHIAEHGEGGVLRAVYSPIPAEVFDALRSAAGPRLIEIRLDACDHRVLAHLRQYPRVADTLATYLGQQIRSPVAGGRYRITVNGD